MPGFSRAEAEAGLKPGTTYERGGFDVDAMQTMSAAGLCMLAVAIAAAQPPASLYDLKTVTSPMFEKVVTKNGAGQSPVYAFLGRSGRLPAWNFSKYVIDKTGRVAAFFPSDVTPEDPKLRAAITRALAN
ncbi:MAG: hypothetical protein A3H29_17520 [Acidobacteria bacterium RIFCSPLOWO2_02_FULL_67_21]|nr:MAG: hypothetical protein A3H29_17520 [Acidobacteria bacterium RIFCSPLOWO2_02_FULL_67_21]